MGAQGMRETVLMTEIEDLQQLLDNTSDELGRVLTDLQAAEVAREALLATNKALVEALEDLLRAQHAHTHKAKGDGTDECADCGKDLRNAIHLRTSEGSALKVRLAAQVKAQDTLKLARGE